MTTEPYPERNRESESMSIKREDVPWRELPHLRIDECVELSSLSRRTISEAIRAGHLGSRQLGRIRVIPTRSFRVWIGEISPSDDPHAELDHRKDVAVRVDRLIRKVG